jgi:hypothetical protein
MVLSEIYTKNVPFVNDAESYGLYQQLTLCSIYSIGKYTRILCSGHPLQWSNKNYNEQKHKNIPATVLPYISA